MPTYHPDRPKGCPCQGATSHTGKMYRGVRRSTIAPIDFLSHGERPRAKCDRTKCKPWGLSVWVDIEDVHFARNASTFLRDQYIAEGDVTPVDGCILKTPSNEQENHYTFWKDINVDFVPRFRVILNPVGT